MGNEAKLPGDGTGSRPASASATDRAQVAPFGRQDVLALVVLSTLLGAVMVSSFHPHYDQNPDAAMYLLCAQSLVEGDGYSYLGAPFVLRPPGFSILLAPLVALVGIDFRVLNLFMGLLGAGTSILIFVFARHRVGPWIAVAACLAIALNDEYLRLLWQVMSDLPGLGLAIAAILCERRQRSSPSWLGEVACSLLIAAGTYVRSMTLFLVPAILVARHVRPIGWSAARPLRRGYFMAVLVALLVVPWVLRDARSRTPDQALQTLSHSYWVATWHQDGSDPASPLLSPSQLVHRVGDHANRLWHLLGNRLRGDDATVGSRVLGAILLSGFFAMLVMRWRVAELWVVASIAVLLLYFTLVPRLALPVYMVALIATTEATLALLLRFGAGRAAPVLVIAALMLVAAAEGDPQRRLHGIEERARLWDERCAHVRATVPDGVPIAAQKGWSYGLLLGRSCPSLHFIYQRQGWEALLEYLEEHRIGGMLWDQNPPFLNRLQRELQRRGSRARIVEGPVRILLIDPPRRRSARASGPGPEGGRGARGSPTHSFGTTSRRRHSR